MSAYSDIQAAISQSQPVAFSGGSNLLHGEKSSFAVTALCDFSASGIPADGYVIDTTPYINRMQLRVVQTVYLDNSNNNGYAEVYNPTFNQSFSLPAGYQGYFPILGAKVSANKFQVTSTGNKVVNVSFLNCLMPLGIWAATVTPPASGLPQAVSDAIVDATVYANRQRVWTLADQTTAADASGSITAAGVSQVLLPANATRQGFVVQNIDSAFQAEALWISPTGVAVVGGPGSISIAAAASLGYPGGASQYQWSNQITIVAASAGHKFTCIQW